MIVVDESIENALIIKSIATWYQGRVVSIRSLRSGTLIHDEAIGSILYQVEQPTFVTINVADFWKRIAPHQRYCIVALDFEQDRTAKLPILLRRLLHLPEFRTKARRMGKVIHATPTKIEYYEADRQIHRLTWPD
jgi:hypothetical protein